MTEPTTCQKCHCELTSGYYRIDLTERYTVFSNSFAIAHESWLILCPVCYKDWSQLVAEFWGYVSVVPVITVWRPDPMIVSDETIKEFAENNGGREVHRSWRDTMLAQGRSVAPARMAWDSLSAEDKILDRIIALEVISDFVQFVRSHPW
jgi:hypothetical protein